MKKPFKVIIIIILILVLTVILAFAGIFINNKVKLKSESAKIIEYGENVEVKNKNIRAYIQGEGEQTFVLLPGYLTGAPKIDFKSLIDELSSNARVVVIEPFGYGMSDDTDEERSVENLVDEVHTVLETLNIKEYNLVTHSIWGVYALQYINTYPDEVTMHIGIDSSLPSQGGADDNQEASIKFLASSGLYRLFASADESFLNGPKLDEQNMGQFKYISLRNIGSDATMNEGSSMKDNFDKTMDLRYPADLPVLYLLATESTDSDPTWLTIHEDMLISVNKGKIVTLEGTHYLHHTKSKEIADEISKFQGEK